MDRTPPADVLEELQSLAVEQQEIRARLDVLLRRRTELVALAREHGLATWKELAEMTGVTEMGLRKANSR